MFLSVGFIKVKRRRRRPTTRIEEKWTNEERRLQDRHVFRKVQRGIVECAFLQVVILYVIEFLVDSYATTEKVSLRHTHDDYTLRPHFSSTKDVLLAPRECKKTLSVSVERT